MGDPDPKAARNANRRASNLGVLEMTLDEYLGLLDWAGRQVRADKPGAIAPDCPPILTRLTANAVSWLDCVLDFGRIFRTAAGRVERLRQHAVSLSRRCLRGTPTSRLAFG
jgi:hypothetical protein